MAKPTKAAASNVKNFDNDKAIEQAVTIKSLNQFMDNATLQVTEQKTLLVTAINTDCVSSIVEDGTVYGNYQIPERYLDETTGKPVITGEVIEVVLSCEPTPLNDQEITSLAIQIGQGNFDKLFEKDTLPTDIKDAGALVAFLAGLPNKGGAFTVSKGGDIKLKLDFTQGIPGVTTKVQFVPRSGFFIKLQEVISDISGDATATKNMADWMSQRIKAAVKTGNRAKETT
jgi:hypothetical protein